MTIKISNLTVKRGEQSILSNLNLDLPTGEIIGLIGPNGAGKTTLLEVITGRLAYNSGTIQVGEKIVIDDPLSVRRSTSFATTPSGVTLNLTGLDYLEIVAAVEMYAAPTKLQLDLMKVIDFDPNLLRRRMSSYSHGELKKISIIASLNENASLFVYDEIFNGLDLPSLKAMKTFFRDFSTEDRTIIVCSHFLQILFDWCDRIVLLNEKTIQNTWPPEDLEKFNGDYVLFEDQALVLYTENRQADVTSAR